VTQLTARETEVVSLIHRDLSNKEIARKLGISEETVTWHAHRAMHKLGVKSRVGMALWWERQVQALANRTGG
jgi:DNA-binding CsgD family transcriptional regulator